MAIADLIIQLFEERGKGSYFGEAVSQTEHGLQAAFFAENEGAPGYLIGAALLHDVGHLLQSQPENIADLGVDAEHEEIGEQWLAQHFGHRVSQPVKLHVAAKRYLCATKPEYLDALSPASKRSLELQGGPMSPQEAMAFEQNTYFKDAIRMRVWDDKAKAPGLAVPGLEHYRSLLQSLLRAPV